MSDKDKITKLEERITKLEEDNENLCKVINILIEKNNIITKHIEDKYNKLLYDFWINSSKF